MKNIIKRLYKRIKSEMPIFFRRMGAFSTALTIAALAGLDHKDKLPESVGHYLSYALSVGITITIFCTLTKIKDVGECEAKKENTSA